MKLLRILKPIFLLTIMGILFVLTLTGCSSDKIALLSEDGEPQYTVIRPYDASVTEHEAANTVLTGLNELSGASFYLKSDFFPSDTPDEEIAATYEILIGKTARAESISAKEELAENEYIITVTGNKIVIVGGSDYATYSAAKEFLKLFETEDNLMLPKDFTQKGEIKMPSYLVALTNQKDSLLEVYDLSKGTLDETSRVWSYEMPYYNIAGAKLRHSETFDDVALAVCGYGYGCMVSYPEGDLIWYTEAAADNPHSIELLPCGVIAIASSNGGEIRFFTTDKKYSKAPAATVSLPDAHGVLWDDKNNVLWAIGSYLLTAYKVTLNDDNSVTVEEQISQRTILPYGNAHDLSPVYGSPDELCITTGRYVYRFNKTTKTFSTEYEGNEYINRLNVKGAGNFTDGSLVYIFPDGALHSWTSQSIVFVHNFDGEMVSERLASKTGHFYKVRVWNSAYQ